MKTVLILGGPAAGQQIEVHGTMRSVFVTITPTHSVPYHLAPMCSHGEVHWFGVLDGADPLALLIAGYAPTERHPGMHPALGMGYANATQPHGDIYAGVAKDFSPTKNRNGECP